MRNLALRELVDVLDSVTIQFLHNISGFIMHHSPSLVVWIKVEEILFIHAELPGGISELSLFILGFHGDLQGVTAWK